MSHAEIKLNVPKFVNGITSPTLYIPVLVAVPNYGLSLSLDFNGMQLQNHTHAQTSLTQVRTGLNRDLGFSPGDRAESVRRVGEMACLFRSLETRIHIPSWNQHT